jgi:hypothetical protein
MGAQSLAAGQLRLFAANQLTHQFLEGFDKLLNPAGLSVGAAKFFLRNSL